MNAQELDADARRRRFIEKMRAELIGFGMSERRVRRLTVQQLIVERSRYTERELMAAPKP